MVDLSPGAVVQVVNPAKVVQVMAPGLVEGVWLKEGPPGLGLPAGGESGQALVKASGSDFDAEWSDAGSGDVVGPASGVVDGRIAEFDGTTGRLLAAGNAKISDLQPIDANLTAIAALTTTSYGRALLELANQAALVALLPSYQPLDSDLTSIAALSTTSYGRAFLALANQAALMALVQASSETAQGKIEIATQTETNTGTDDARAVTPLKLQTRLAAYAQPLDSDLTAIAALTTTAYGRAFLALADAAAARSALTLGNSATKDTGTGSGDVAAGNHTHTLAAGATDVTASAAEVNVLDGITASTTELNYVDGVTSAIQTQLNALAPKASPAFTGNPTAPTPSTGDNDTSIATTAFVKAQGYAPVASPTFTGTVTTPALKVTTGAAALKVMTSDTDGDATWAVAPGTLLDSATSVGAGSYFTDSTTPEDVDATNLAVTFTVPASGAVRIALAGCNSTFDNGYVWWCLRTGSTNVPGTERRLLRQGDSIDIYETFEIALTGLTPGASVTYKWGWRVEVEATIFYGGTEFSGSTNYGPATIAAYAC